MRSQASSTENNQNMPEEQQHGTESKHHRSRTDKCRTSALSSASSTVNNREHASGAAARNGVQASSFQNKSAARMRSQVHQWQRTTENMPVEQQHGTESKHHLSRTKKVQHECVVKCIINREQRRTCQWSSSTERSPSIIFPEQKKVQHECVVKCIINREQQRTCQRSSSTERSPSIIVPQRTSAA